MKSNHLSTAGSSSRRRDGARAKPEPDRGRRAPSGHCLWCGAYLAGSWTQHAEECWMYGFTKDVSLPDELRDYLKSLARRRPKKTMIEPYPEGTEVEKINSQPGDMHQNGAIGHVFRHFGTMQPGTVLGDGEVLATLEFGYFVQWRDFKIPVFIRGSRLRARSSGCRDGN